jgi:hypothetical protein
MLASLMEHGISDAQRDETRVPSGQMLACRVLGHRWRFSNEGRVMRWECSRGCGAEGSKRYPSAAHAARYARAFDREDSEDLGRRPLLSLLPLALSRRARTDRNPGGR